MTANIYHQGYSDHGKPTTSAAEWRSMVVKFYETYNPEKVKDVDLIMAEYEGREVELFQELVNKYNVHTQVVVNEVHDGSPVDSRHMSTSAGHSWGMPGRQGSAVSERSSSKGSMMSDGLRLRLSRLKQQNPHSDDGELMLAAVEQQRSWRNAIIKFYQEHQPSKLANISEIFNECDGEEEMLYNLIVSKYKKNNQKALVPAIKSQKNAVTQCTPTATNVKLPTTPLTTQLDITGGEMVGIEDINDQLEWSVLVVLEQEERMRGILSRLTQKGADPHLIKETSERLLSIQKEAHAIRKLFDAQQAANTTPLKSVQPSVSGSLPPPPIIGSGLTNFRDRASTSPPMVTPSSFAVPLGTSTPFVRRRSESSSPGLQRHLISPPAPLPTNSLGVNTQALIDAVNALQKKGVTMPSPQELRVR